MRCTTFVLVHCAVDLTIRLASKLKRAGDLGSSRFHPEPGEGARVI